MMSITILWVAGWNTPEISSFSQANMYVTGGGHIDWLIFSGRDSESLANYERYCQLRQLQIYEICSCCSTSSGISKIFGVIPKLRKKANDRSAAII